MKVICPGKDKHCFLCPHVKLHEAKGNCINSKFCPDCENIAKKRKEKLKKLNETTK